MIGLMLRMASAPMQLILCGGAVAALCGCLACVACRGCRIRDCACIRWWLRAINHDTFDDFDVLVQVHEISLGAAKNQHKSSVRLTAGVQTVSTGKSKKGFFQEVLSILIEQGTDMLVVDLMADGGVLATLKLDIMDVIKMQSSSAPPTTYNMTRKSKNVDNPTVTLTIFASSEDDDDETNGNFNEQDMETTFLMRQHLAMAQTDMNSKQGVNKLADSLGGAISDTSGDVEVLDVLIHACCGVVEVFQGWGSVYKRYIHVTGPPVSRRFILGIYKDEKDRDSEKELDVLKIQSVQSDPGKTDVFHISFYDKHHVSKKLTCRTTDRATKVWVESLTLLITRVHSLSNSMKKDRKEEKTKAHGKQVPAEPPARPTTGIRGLFGIKKK